MIKTVCVFCGARPGSDPAIRAATLSLGDELARRGQALVYGGSSTGLMGELADRVLSHGGAAIGVIPQNLLEKEVAHQGLTEQHQVASMAERKERMMARSDAFIALPGGYGTLDELFEALTWSQLSLHGRSKPVGVLNVGGYYDALLSFLDNACDKGLLHPDNRSLLVVADTPAELLERLASAC